MTRSLFVLSSLGSALFAMAPLAYARSARYAPPPRIITVRMVDKSATEYLFEPSQITARPGDVVQFIQTTQMPHNVEFRETPAGVDLGAVKTSAYLTTPNQKYEIVIDKKFVKGTYNFTCVPHETMGMKGALTVVAQ